MKLLKQSSTAQELLFLMIDSADHVSPKTGLSPTVTIRKAGGSFASPSGAVSEIANGWYKVAGNATDTNTLGPLLLHASATGADPSDVEFAVVAFDPQDAVRIGMSSLPNAAAEAAGGLYTRGTGAGQINQDANGRVDVSLKAILGTTLTETAGQIAAAFKKFFDKASPTGTVNSIPDAVAGANGGLPTVDASNRVAGIQGTTKHTLDDLNDLSGTSIASAVWNALTSGMSTVGSIGKRIVDYLTGDVFARVGAPAGASLADDVAAVKAVDDAIKAKTDALPTDPADESALEALIAAVQSDTNDLQTRVPAALTADGNMKSDALRINGNANAAARLALSAAEIRPGTVDATAFTPTTTEFESDDITTAAPDFWNGAIVLFTSGALQGQKTTVSDYSVVGGRGHFTVVAVTSAPADNVTFVLI